MSNENDLQTATGILEQLNKGKGLHDHFAKQFREGYFIAGKLIADWKQRFQIEIPPDLNPQTCKELDLKILELHQEASFLKAEVDARLAAYRNTNNDRYREKFTALVTEYKNKGDKLPAKDTLAALAEHAVGNIKNAMVHAEIELAFWKEILNDLANSRKLIDNITINLSVEAKALQHERALDRLGSQYGKE